jgi:hypothetical protein
MILLPALALAVGGCDASDQSMAAAANDQADKKSGWSEDVTAGDTKVIAVDWNLGWMLDIPDSGSIKEGDSSGNRHSFTVRTPLTRQQGWLRYQLPDKQSYDTMQIGLTNPVYDEEFHRNKNGFIPVFCLIRRADQKGNCVMGYERDDSSGSRFWSADVTVFAKYHPDWWSKAEIIAFTTQANWLTRDNGFRHSAEMEDFNAALDVAAYEPKP